MRGGVLVFLCLALIWLAAACRTAERRAAPGPAPAIPPSDIPAVQPPPAPPNLPFWTMGGKQYWADLFVHAGWRIQENVLTGHCRLLDPDQVHPRRGGPRSP